jgi:DNA invertase Pin-like site-specific DNA recombinase
MERPGFVSMMASLKPGDSIVVWRLDRLGRTAKGLTKLFDDLAKLKVNLVSLKDGLDLSTAAGRLMANVLASVAQYETEIRSERVLAGLAASTKRKGRPAGVHTAIKVTADHKRIILEEKAKGTPIATIARLVAMSRQTVYEVLKSNW